jgi:hypothetical protein
MGLDTVELVIAWEVAFDVSISEAEAKAMFTTRQVVEAIFEKVKSDLPEDRGCLSRRGFFRLRDAFKGEGVARKQVRLDTKVAALLPDSRRRDALSAVAERAGLRPLRRLPFGLQFTFGRVRDVVTDAVIEQHDRLRLAGHGWSLAQVREVVRTVVATRHALHRFSDDAEFVKDLGID